MGCCGREGVGRAVGGLQGAEWREDVRGVWKQGYRGDRRGSGRGPRDAGGGRAVPAHSPRFSRCRFRLSPGAGSVRGLSPREAGPGLTSASSLKSPHPSGTLKAPAPESQSLARVGVPAATQLSAASEGSSGCLSLAPFLQTPLAPSSPKANTPTRLIAPNPQAGRAPSSPALAPLASLHVERHPRPRWPCVVYLVPAHSCQTPLQFPPSPHFPRPQPSPKPEIPCSAPTPRMPRRPYRTSIWSPGPPHS